MIEEKISGYGKLKRWVGKRVKIDNDCIFVGPEAGYSNTSGVYNTFLGRQAGYNHTTGNQCVFIGNGAGFHETANNTLFIDNANRASEADGRVKALIYGTFHAAPASQRLSINARILIRECPTYADDAAAGVGGLVAGEVWKTAAGVIHIKL